MIVMSIHSDASCRMKYPSLTLIMSKLRIIIKHFKNGQIADLQRQIIALVGGDLIKIRSVLGSVL